MDKGTLKGYLDRSEFFEETDALFIFKQIVLGLKEYHENQIKHENLNLNNIIITNNYIKISDFAKTNKEEYLSPEVLEGREKTFASDLYACGVILYKMLYGVFPYTGQKREDIINAINQNVKEIN